jgi:hypothetical protein
MPQASFFVPRMIFGSGLDSQTIYDQGRIAGVSGYGYNLDATQSSILDSRIKLFRQNGGLPDFYIDSLVSINRNIFATSATLSTQTLTLAIGTYTFSFLTGAGSITSSSGTATASNHGAVSAGGSRTITVTVAGTVTFTVSGTVNSAQLEAGSVQTAYVQRADATAPKVLNLGSKNASGDCSYVAGTNANMVAKNATAGLVHNFVATASQGLQANFLDWYPNYTVIVAYNATVGLGGALWIKSNASDRIVVNGDGSFRFNGTTGLVQSAVGALTASTWSILAITVQGTTVTLYKNGVALTPATNTLSVRTTESATNWSISTSAFLNGLTSEHLLIPAALTATQVANIFNGMKSRYGL